QDVREAGNLAEKSSVKKPTTAIIQVSTEANSALGTKSLLGSLLQKISVENIFADIPESSELDMEALLHRDPEYLVLYGHGGDGPKIARKFAEQLEGKDSIYRNMRSVKNQSYIVIRDPGSANLQTSRLLLDLARAIYEP
ncbi:MAG: hypothetical protein AAF975_06080, partial [Spirochaetota bacterium]